MNRTQKTELASELKEKFNRAKVLLFADYKGLTAVQADELRRALRLQNTEVKVLKNNIARLAMKDEKFGKDAQTLLESVIGPTLVAFVYGDPAAAAKVIHKFSKDNEALKLKDSLLGTKRIDPALIAELASLPSKEVLLAKLLGSLNSPVTSFLGVLNAVPRSLVLVLAAIEKKKGEAEPAKG